MIINLVSKFFNFKKRLAQIEWNRKIINYNFNWAYVLCFVGVWSYVIFNPVKKIFGVLAIFLTFLLGKRKEFEDNLSVTRQSAAVFFSYLVIILIFSFKYLNTYLSGDEVYDAGKAQALSLWLGSRIAENFTLFAGPFKYILYIANFLILSSGALAIVIFRKINYLYKSFFLLFIISFLLFILPEIFNTQPAFYSFLLFMTSSIFLKDFAFKFTSLLIITAIIFACRQFLKSRQFSFWQSYFIPFSIATIDKLLYINSIVVSSIWSPLIFTALLLFIFLKKESRNINYIRWFSLISISSFIRFPDFIACLPLGMMMIYEFIAEKKYKQYNNFLTFALNASPLILMIPAFLTYFIYGTSLTRPITQHKIGLLNNFSSSLKYLLKVCFSFHIWSVFAIFGFIPFKKNDLMNKVAVFIFFVFLITIHYSIPVKNWPEIKYHIEYIVPFTVFGLFSLLIKIRENKKTFLVNYIILALIFLNLFLSHKLIKRKAYEYVNYKKIFTQLKEGKLFSSSLFPGEMAGVFMYIIDGDCNYLEYKKLNKLHHDTSNLNYDAFSNYPDFIKRKNIHASKDFVPFDFDKILKHPEVKALLFFWQPEKDILLKLKQNNWEKWYDFTPKHGGITTFGFSRRG